MDKTQKIVIIVTHADDDPERATLAFVLANACLAMDVAPFIVLQSEAVRLGTKGYADRIQAPGLEPLKNLLDNVLAEGCSMMLCGPCVKERRIQEADMLPGCFVGGAGKVVEAMLEAANCVRY